MTRKIGISKAPGTCGELVQGFCKDGIPFHVTCPITLYANATVEITPGTGLRILGLPDYATKMKYSLELTAKALEIENIDIHVRHHTQLQTGKGMGSSTADILCVATAFTNAINKHLDPKQLAQIATTIESSDGTAYSGIAAVNHKNGDLIKAFEWYPEFNIIIVVPDEQLDTAQVTFSGKESLSQEFDSLLEKMNGVSLSKNERAFAEVALQSALLNQKYIENKYFQQLYPVYAELGAIGLNVAHTGTMMGLLYQSGKEGMTKCNKALPEIREIVGKECDVKHVRIESKREWQV